MVQICKKWMQSLKIYPPWTCLVYIVYLKSKSSEPLPCFCAKTWRVHSSLWAHTLPNAKWSIFGIYSGRRRPHCPDWAGTDFGGVWAVKIPNRNSNPDVNDCYCWLYTEYPIFPPNFFLNASNWGKMATNLFGGAEKMNSFWIFQVHFVGPFQNLCPGRIGNLGLKVWVDFLHNALVFLNVSFLCFDCWNRVKIQLSLEIPQDYT